MARTSVRDTTRMSVTRIPERGEETASAGSLPTVQVEQLPDGVVQIVFDRPGSSANVFDLSTLNELDAILEQLSGRPDVNGLILTTGKPAIFMAGADVKALFRDDATEEEVRHAVRTGQAVFNKLAAFEVPTVAAIHGAAMGGDARWRWPATTL